MKRKCEVCGRTATRGFKQKWPTRCLDDILDNMVVRPQRYCEHNKYKSECGKCNCKHDTVRASCQECKKERETRKAMKTKRKIRHSSRCNVKDCSNLAEYASKTCVPTHCEQHKQTDHVFQPLQYCEHMMKRTKCIPCKGQSICKHNLERRRCHKCYPDSSFFCSMVNSDSNRICDKTASSKYNGYCVPCFVESFPDDELSKTVYLRIKELDFKKYLDKTFPDEFVYNKRVITPGEKMTVHNRHLDFQKKEGNCLIIIELDEAQHKYYDPVDEKQRIYDIYDDAKSNIVLVKMNPDNYRIDGVLTKTPIVERYEALADKVREIKDRINNGSGYSEWLTEYKLFFDNGVYIRIPKVIKNQCIGITRKNKRCKNGSKGDGDVCRAHGSYSLL